jgi:transcriptional regulator with XRE-family HTH domain
METRLPKQYNLHQKLRVDGAKLTEARLRAQLSMRDVVQQLGDGCNKSSVSRWEQGTLIPSRERIFKLAELYGCGDFIVAVETETTEEA